MTASSLLLAALLAAPAAFAVDSGDIVVASVKGEVHATLNGAVRPLRAGLVLELPAAIRTGRDGAVELEQGATTVSIAADTLLEFPALEKRGAPIDRIRQPRGNAFYDVGKRDGRKLRVETPYLVAVIKGTQFNVAVQDDSSVVSLFEGRLEIQATDESAVVDLEAGEIASRKRGEKTITVIRMDTKVPPAPSRAPRSSRDSSGNSVTGNGSAGVNVPRGNTDNGESLPVAGVSVDTRAGLDASANERGAAGATSLAVAAGASVDVGTGSVPVDVAAGAGVGASVAPGTIDVAAATTASVAAGPVSVDLATNTTVDVAPTGVSVDTGAGAALEAGSLTTTADAAASVDVSGTGASASVAADVGVTPAASVETSVVTVVDLGTAPAANVDVDLGGQVAGIAASAAAAVDVAGGNIDLGVTVGNLGVDLGVDLGLDDKEDTTADTAADDPSTDTTDNGTVVDVGGLLDGLLRRPGRK